MNIRKMVSLALFLVTVVSFCSCNKENIIPDGNDNSTVSTEEASQSNSDTMAEPISYNTSSADTYEKNKKESEISKEPSSTSPVISEQSFKELEDLVAWVKDSSNITFFPPENKEVLEPMRDLLKEKGVFYPVINGKPAEADYGDESQPYSVLISKSIENDYYHLHFFTKATDSGFSLYYPIGPLKEAADKGVLEYEKKHKELKGYEVSDDIYKHYYKDVVSYKVHKINLTDVNSNKTYKTDCIIVEYEDATEIEFAYKGVIVYIFDRGNFAESADFEKLGFIDLIKDN